MYLLQAGLLQFHNLQLKVGSSAEGIEADPAGEPLHLQPLHVVDEAVAVLPALLPLAAQGGRHHVLTGRP